MTDYLWREGDRTIAKYVSADSIELDTIARLSNNEACGYEEDGVYVGTYSSIRPNLKPKPGIISKLLGKKAPQRDHLFVNIGPHKLIMKIKTNSLEPGQPKDINNSILYDIYRAFATPEETKNIQLLYQEGIAWGEMKNILFECINDQLKPARREFQRLIDDPAEIENQLKKGARKAREISVPYIQKIRNAVGIRKLI